MKNKSTSSPENIGAGSFSRHANSLRHGGTPSEQYPSLTEKGAEQARESARNDLLEVLEKAPADVVMFIGAKSDQERTGHTAEIYGDELKAIAADRGDLIVITKREIDEMKASMTGEEGDNKIIDKIKEIVFANPDKKIVIDYPLRIKELSYAYRDRWTQKDETGKDVKTEYFDTLVKKHGGSHAKAVHEWIRDNGVLTTEDGRQIQGPSPEDVAKQYLLGLERVYQFAKSQLGERSVIIHGTGHQWDLDAVATYLAKGGVTYQDFLDVMGRENEDIEKHPIGESEVISDITIDPHTNQTTVRYRGREYKGIVRKI